MVAVAVNVAVAIMAIIIGNDCMIKFHSQYNNFNIILLNACYENVKKKKKIKYEKQRISGLLNYFNSIDDE